MRSGGCGSWSGWRAAQGQGRGSRPACGGTYAIPLAVRLAGALDRAALEGALNDLVGRHESLRTRVPGERWGCRGRRWWRRLRRGSGSRSRASREDELAAALAAAVGRGFDLARELPLRAHLYALEATVRPRAAAGAAPHRRRRLVAASAAAGPGGAVPGAAWRARRPRCRALPVQYADYTLWQQAVLGEEGEADSAIARQLAFWKEALKELPEQIELPADRPRPAVSSHRGGHVALTHRCRAAPRAGGAVAVDGREPVHGAAGGACGSADAAGGRDRHRAGQPGRRADAMRRWTSWSGSSSTRWCFAPTRRASAVRRADRPGADARTLRPMRMRSFRSSGWSRCSIRRGRCRGIRCSR